MKKPFPVIFVLVMILCVCFIAWYLPSVASLRFRLEDTAKSLETSYGRERKQQHEYDETVAEIPIVQAELESIRPLTDAALQEVSDLKAQRKQLREKKKELEKGLDSSAGKEDESNE